MSLFGSLGKAIGGVAKSALGQGIGKKLLGAIPGVGTAIAIGSVAYDVYNAAKPKATSPYQPPAGPMPGGRVTRPVTGTGTAVALSGNIPSYTVYEAAKLSKSSMPYEQQLEMQRALDAGQISQAQVNATFFGDAQASVINTAGVMQAGVPGWGNLASRGGAVVGSALARIAKKWYPVVMNGVLVWQLVDAAGNILDISKTKPHRKMNVLNPRALRRADRRMEGFSRYAAKALKSYGYHVSSHRHAKKSITSKRKRR